MVERGRGKSSGPRVRKTQRMVAQSPDDNPKTKNRIEPESEGGGDSTVDSESRAAESGDDKQEAAVAQNSGSRDDEEGGKVNCDSNDNNYLYYSSMLKMPVMN